MDKNEFLNRLRILYSIDGWELDNFLNDDAQDKFMRDPIRFLLRSDDERQDKIWAIIERRSKPREQTESKHE